MIKKFSINYKQTFMKTSWSISYVLDKSQLSISKKHDGFRPKNDEKSRKKNKTLSLTSEQLRKITEELLAFGSKQLPFKLKHSEWAGEGEPDKEDRKSWRVHEFSVSLLLFDTNLKGISDEGNFEQLILLKNSLDKLL